MFKLGLERDTVVFRRILACVQCGNRYVIRWRSHNVQRGCKMETAPALVPAPAIVADRTKPVIIRPPEVSAAHDFAVIGYILTFLLSLPWLLIAAVIFGIGLAAYIGLVILPPVLPPVLVGIPFLGPLLVFLVFTLTPSFTVYMALGGGVILFIILFLAAIYFGIVRNINKGRYERARNAALFWGVLFIIPSFFALFSTALTGFVIAILPAFFFLMTFGRLGEVIAKYGPVAVMGEAVPGAPFAGPPGAPVPPIGGPIGAPIAGPPGLGPPMAGFPSQDLGLPMPPGGPPLTGVAPRIPLCPGCGRELYYSANHRRWYCMTCDNPMATSGRGLPHP